MARARLRSQLSIWNRQQDWPFEPSDCYFLARAAQILHPEANEGLRELAASAMQRHLANGELSAVALLLDGTLAPIRSEAWVVSENFAKWFSTCQITNFDLFGAGMHPLAGVTDHWLFIKKAGLDAKLALQGRSGRRTVAGREGFKQRLVDFMSASPNRRSISKEQQIAIGTDEFNLSKREAINVREQALAIVSDTVRQAWSKPGPTVPMDNS